MARQYEALPTLLDRDFAVAFARPIIDEAGPLLREVVNVGTQIFGRCASEPGEYERDAEVAALTLFHTILEFTDGIYVLVTAACGPTMAPLLRSSFEAVASLSYMLRDPERFVDRARAWVVGHVFNLVAEQERYLQIAESDYPEAVEEDAKAKSLEAVQAWKELLGQDHLAPVVQEYEAERKRQRRRRVAWFSLWGGSQNRRELAAQAGRTPDLSVLREYDVFYRRWSAAAHAEELRGAFTQAEEAEGPAVYRLRNPADLAQNAELAAAFCNSASGLILRWFRPGEFERENARREWFEAQVRPRRERLRRLQQEFGRQHGRAH